MEYRQDGASSFCSLLIRGWSGYRTWAHLHQPGPLSRRESTSHLNFAMNQEITTFSTNKMQTFTYNWLNHPPFAQPTHPPSLPVVFIAMQNNRSKVQHLETDALGEFFFFYRPFPKSMAVLAVLQHQTEGDFLIEVHQLYAGLIWSVALQYWRHQHHVLAAIKWKVGVSLSEMYVSGKAIIYC